MNEQDFRNTYLVEQRSDDPGHLMCYARLVNVNGGAFAIIASLRFHEGELRDWAAYWNGYDPELSKREAMMIVAKEGNKLPYRDAEHFFPDLPMSRYREQAMKQGVIGREEFEQTHRCKPIEQDGPGTTYVALARMARSNGLNACIVARVMFNRQDGLREWTVFLGSAAAGDTVLAAAQEIIETGGEMLQRDGEHFFPRLPGSYYR